MPDIDYGQILESLNNKVDLSGSWSAPTNQRVDLTYSLGTEQNYTAPADGWFVARTGSTAGDIEIRNETTTVNFSIPHQQPYLALSCPARNGDTVMIRVAGSAAVVRFVYAQKTN